MNSKEIIKCILVSFLLLIIIKMSYQIITDVWEGSITPRQALETPFPKPLNKENQQINIENWASINSPEAQVIQMMIKETHSRCPVMGNHQPKVSVCIQDPKTNKGYIISLCCTHCLEKIQTSMKMNDKQFTIRKLNHIDVLYHKDEPKQIAIPCNVVNLQKIMKLIGTKRG
jgi:hypothetical protein